MKKNLLVFALILGAVLIFGLLNMPPEGSLAPAAEENNREYIEAETAEETLDLIIKNSDKDTTNGYRSLAIQKEGKKALKQMLDNTQNEEELRLSAAAAFFGLYISNVEVRNEYCKANGASLAPFVRAFKDYNAKQYIIAKRILKEENISQDDVIAEMMPSLKKVIAIDMGDVAKMVRGKPKDACRFMNDKSFIMVRRINLEKASPEMYKILMAAE